MVADAFGTLLKQQRKSKRYSQLELANEADISSRHLSFMETGRSAPSREMVLHLARVLDCSLKDANVMLSAAGFAQVYRQRTLDDPDMKVAKDALQLMLSTHDPYPAVVIDNHWNLMMFNTAQQKLVELLVQNGAVFPATLNLLDHFFAPKGYRDFVEDWQTFAVYLLQRVEKELLLQGEADEAKILIDRLASYPEVPKDWRTQSVSFENSPMVKLCLNVGGQRIQLFSTIAIFGTPLDVTLQGIRVEHYFPADQESKAFFEELAK